MYMWREERLKRFGKVSWSILLRVCVYVTQELYWHFWNSKYCIGVDIERCTQCIIVMCGLARDFKLNLF